MIKAVLGAKPEIPWAMRPLHLNQNTRRSTWNVIVNRKHVVSIKLRRCIVARMPTSRGCTFHQSLGRFTRSEEHTSELQSLMRISYAVFCLKKKKKQYYSH